MDFNKVNLFKTVKSLHEKGAVTLTASEQALIDRETKELLSNAMNRTAGKAPEGFDKLLEELKTSQNPDEAFDAVLQFMDSQGDIDKEAPNGDIPGEEVEDAIGEKIDSKPDMDGKGPGKPDMDGKGPDKPDMDGKGPGKPDMDGKGPGKPDMDGKGPGKDDKPDMGGKGPGKPDTDGKGPGKDDKPDMGGKGPGKPDMDGKGPGKDDKPEKDVEKDKKDLVARAKRLDRKAKSQSEKDLQNLKDDESEEDEMSADAMGIKDSRTVTVKVTADRNVIVFRGAKPASFHTVANDITDLELKRIANRLLGITVHEGSKAAVAKLGGRLAGVDDDVDLVVEEEISPASDPVVEDGDDVIEDTVETPASEITNDAEFVTEETPKSARRRRKAEGVDDGIEIAVKDDMDNNVDAVTESDEDVIEESKETPADDTQADADVNFQTVESNIKTLYANRSKKEVTALNKKFIDKFVRAFKVASTRMSLNHDEHQFKIAAYDVLMSETDIEEDDAVEVSEAIAEAGHTAFVDQILARTAALMQKSEEYLRDAESDLKNQSVRVAEVSVNKRASNSRSLKKAASAGNFGNVRTPAPSSINNNNGGLREVIGSTPTSKLASRLQELKG